MAGSASIQVAGIPELTHALSQFSAEAQTPRRLFLDLMREVVQPAIDKRFSQAGPGWPPLSPQYAAWKAKKFPGRPLLVQTGAMRGALTGLGSQQGSINGNVLDLTPRGIPYFAVHQLGGGRRIPARPMIVMSELDKPIADYIETYLAKKATELGLSK